MVGRYEELEKQQINFSNELSNQQLTSKRDTLQMMMGAPNPSHGSNRTFEKKVGFVIKNNNKA